jgi:hypothetical protein
MPALDRPRRASMPTKKMAHLKGVQSSHRPATKITKKTPEAKCNKAYKHVAWLFPIMADSQATPAKPSPRLNILYAKYEELKYAANHCEAAKENLNFAEYNELVYEASHRKPANSAPSTDKKGIIIPFGGYHWSREEPKEPKEAQFKLKFKSIKQNSNSPRMKSERNP